jgi:hypothetical protein
VLFGAPWWSAGVIVVAVADAILLVSLTVTPVPIFALMGGVMQDAAVRRLAAAAFVWHLLSVLALLPLLIALLVVARVRQRPWLAPDLAPVRQALRPAVIAALVVLVTCSALLPRFQPAQRNRSAIERAHAAGDQEGVVRLAVACGRAALPPDWHLPRATSSAAQVARLSAASAPEVPDWVVAEVLGAGGLHGDRPELVARILIQRPALIPAWERRLPHLLVRLEPAQQAELQAAIDRVVPVSQRR